MNLKNLSNDELNHKLMALVKTEREVLSEILLHIQEVERRRLYLKMAYPNLFEYMTKYLSYSAGSAQRRIDAARLSREVPTVIAALENGEINLAQVSLLQKGIRQAEKKNRNELKAAKTKETLKVSPEEKQKLVEELKQKSFSESEVLVSQALEIEITKSTQIHHQADASVRLEVILTKEQWDKMNQMRELLSHSLPSGSWAEVLEYLATKVIEKKSSKTTLRNDSSTNKTDTASKTTKGNFIQIRRNLIQNHQSCQYQDPNTGKICGSRWKLEVDHIQPRWAQGSNAPENLRVLCSNHNKELYRKQTNISFL